MMNKETMRQQFWFLQVLEDAATRALDEGDMRRHEHYARRYHEVAKRLRRG